MKDPKNYFALFWFRFNVNDHLLFFVKHYYFFIVVKKQDRSYPVQPD